MALRYQDRPLLGDEDDQKEGVERWRRQTRLSVILDRLHASWPYAGWVALVVMAACQGFLAVKLSTVPPMAEPLGEINGLVPSYGPRTIRFTTDYKQGLRAMNETELAWQDIMPVGSGFIKVEHPEQHSYALPPPIKTHGDNVYSIAVFHQLHCLHFMLKEVNMLYKAGSHSQRDIVHAHGPGSDAYRHMGHCFDYLRSSLMCCGDTALEGQAAGLDAAGTLGLGAHHVCKNFEAIRSWAEMSRASDMQGFSD